MTISNKIKTYFPYLIYTGYLLWLVSIFLPKELSYGLLVADTYLTTSLTLLILPKIGLICLILAVIYRKLWAGIASLALIFSFPISMALGYLLLGA